MSNLDKLFSILKGGPGSGHWAHAGRPGKVGGSSTGGGLHALGLTRNSPIAIRRERGSRTSQVRRSFRDIDEKKLVSHYNLDGNCAIYPLQCDGLSRYSESYYSNVNGSLREHKVLPPNLPPSTFGPIEKDSKLSVIQAIDSAFSNLKEVPEDMTVYRAVDGSKMADILKPGTVFRDYGFTSTSIRPGTFEEAGLMENMIEMKINISKGTKGIYIDPISTFDGEMELLLNRESKFNILSNDGRNIVAELVLED